MSNFDYNADMKIVLTGDRPTGALHLGHYVGSLQNRVKMQHDYKTYIMIANIQGLTDYYHNPQLLNKNVYQVVEDYIASGIVPEKVTIFLQSEVKALFEITVYYMNLVTLARVQRNPTVKEELKQKDFKNNIPCGFLCYPISQAADITAFLADYVPVGKDQLPMIEQTNEIVDKFNSLYSCNVLKRCEAVLSENSKLMGIDGNAKASKSLNNAIFLNDSLDVVKQKVMSMYTDPTHIRISDPGKIEGNMVFHYLDTFYEDKDHLNQLKEDYSKGGLGDVVLKNLLFSTLQKVFEPINERRIKINQSDITEILHDGNLKANAVADSTLNNIRKILFV